MALTRVDFQKTVGTNGDAQSTASMTYEVDDLFIVICGNDGNNRTYSTPVFSGGTFSSLGSGGGGASDNSKVQAWSCVCTSAGSDTIDLDSDGPTTDWYKGYVWQLRGHDGIGDTSFMDGGTSPALTMSNANTGTNSWVVQMLCDWNAAAAGHTGTPTVTNEVDDTNHSTHYTLWGADWSGQSGTVAYGVTAWSGHKNSGAVVEVLEGEEEEPPGPGVEVPFHYDLRVEDAILDDIALKWDDVDRSYLRVAYDAHTSSTVNDSTTLTFAHTPGPITDFLTVPIQHRYTALRTVSGVTFGGVALTQVPSAVSTRAAQFMGSDIWYLKEPALETVIGTESSNKSDSTTLGPDHTWTEVTGDSAVEGNAWRPGVYGAGPAHRARCETDIGSADMYAEGVVSNKAIVSITAVGVMVRYDAAANTGYIFDVAYNAGSIAEIKKVVAGTETQLAVWNQDWVNGDVIRLEVRGTALRAYVNGALVKSCTDSSITTGSRAGVWGVRANASDDARFTSLEFGKLSADVVVTMSATANITATAISASNVNQTTPLGTAAIADNNSTDPTVTATAAEGDLVVDSCNGHTNGGGFTVGFNQASLAQQTTSSGTAGTNISQAVSYEPAVANSVVMGWARPADHWCTSAVALKVFVPEAPGGDEDRTNSDPVGVTDSITATVTYAQTKSDPVGILDVMTQFQGFVQAFSDAVGILDAASGVQVDARTHSDPVGVLDARTQESVFARTNSDAVGILDSAAQTSVAAQTVSDPVGLTDATAQFVGQDQLKSDPIGLTDAATLVTMSARSVSDPVGLLDAAAQATAFARIYSDPVGLTDAMTQNFAADYAQTQSDPVGILDSATAARAVAQTNSDAVGILDSVTRASVADRTHSDPVGITDARTIDTGQFQTYSDSVGITDAATSASVAARTASDPIGTTDSLSQASLFARTTSDAIGGTDAATYDKVIAVAHTDAVGILDLASPVEVAARALADAVGITDQATGAGVFARTQSDSVGVTDTRASAQDWVRALADVVGLLDSRSQLQTVLRTIADTVDITDLMVQLYIGVVIPSIGVDAWGELVYRERGRVLAGRSGKLEERDRGELERGRSGKLLRHRREGTQ